MVGPTDPLLRSVIAKSAVARTALVACIVGCLWLAIGWAEALP